MAGDLHRLPLVLLCLFACVIMCRPTETNGFVQETVAAEFDEDVDMSGSGDLKPLGVDIQEIDPTLCTPQTIRVMALPNDSKLKATFSLAVSDSESELEFTCYLDGQLVNSKCTSPLEMEGIPKGAHQLRIVPSMCLSSSSSSSQTGGGGGRVVSFIMQ